MAKSKTPSEPRGVNIALARLTPQQGTATFNRASLTAMGNPTKVVFYDLGEGQVIVQPHTETTTPRIFNALLKKKVFKTARQFSLTVRNGTAVFRTPAWLRNMREKGKLAHSPVAGLLIEELSECLFFDFSEAAETGNISLEDIETARDHESDVTSYEQTALRGPRAKTKKDEEPAKKRKKKLAVPAKAVEEDDEEEITAAPPDDLDEDDTDIDANIDPDADEDEETWNESEEDEDTEDADEEDDESIDATARYPSRLTQRPRKSI